MIRLWKAIKRSFSAYLERLAQANKAQFGEEKLNCCDLNTGKGHHNGS